MNTNSKPLSPPPMVIMKETFFGLIETKESKRRTKAWEEGKCNSCIYGYDGSNGNGYQPCGCKYISTLNGTTGDALKTKEFN